jgi:hypothetical protein
MQNAPDMTFAAPTHIVTEPAVLPDGRIIDVVAPPETGLQLGHSLASIAATLDAEGLRPRYGPRWHAATTQDSKGQHAHCAGRRLNAMNASNRVSRTRNASGSRAARGIVAHAGRYAAHMALRHTFSWVRDAKR